MKKHTRQTENILLYSAFSLYIILLFAILIFKNVPVWEVFNANRHMYRSANIVPFQTITRYLSAGNIASNGSAILNVFGNIALFLPLGIYLTLFCRDKRIFVNSFKLFSISLLVEISQYMFAIGASDIDDVILNSLGGFLGVVIYKALFAILKKDEKKVRSIIAKASTVCAIFVLFALYFYGIRYNSAPPLR